MSRVFVSTPVHGAISENLELARRLTLCYLAIHNHPVCPHLFTIQALGLSDLDPKQRFLGMDYGFSELSLCDECHIVLRKDKTLSDGCAQERDFCVRKWIPYTFLPWPEFLMEEEFFYLRTARTLVKEFLDYLHNGDHHLGEPL